MNILANSVSALNASLRTICAENVTYRRGNEAIEGLVAIPANTRHDDYGELGDELTARERDWIVWAGDLLLGGEEIEPQRGDVIDWTDVTGQKRTFDVLPRINDRCYRHTDQTMQQLRIYTVESVLVSE